MVTHRQVVGVGTTIIGALAIKACIGFDGTFNSAAPYAFAITGFGLHIALQKPYLSNKVELGLAYVIMLLVGGAMYSFNKEYGGGAMHNTTPPATAPVPQGPTPSPSIGVPPQ